MKTMIAKAQKPFRKAGCLLAGLPDTQPQLRPIPVPVERVLERRRRNLHVAVKQHSSVI